MPDEPTEQPEPEEAEGEGEQGATPIPWSPLDQLAGDMPDDCVPVLKLPVTIKSAAIGERLRISMDIASDGAWAQYALHPALLSLKEKQVWVVLSVAPRKPETTTTTVPAGQNALPLAEGGEADSEGDSICRKCSLRQPWSKQCALKGCTGTLATIVEFEERQVTQIALFELLKTSLLILNGLEIQIGKRRQKIIERVMTNLAGGWAYLTPDEAQHIKALVDDAQSYCTPQQAGELLKSVISPPVMVERLLQPEDGSRPEETE